MSSELVLQDLAADEQKLLKCITAHPGFNTVCLKKLEANKSTVRQDLKKSNISLVVFPLRASLGYDCASVALFSERL